MELRGPVLGVLQPGAEGFGGAAIGPSVLPDQPATAAPAGAAAVELSAPSQLEAGPEKPPPPPRSVPDQVLAHMTNRRTSGRNRRGQMCAPFLGRELWERGHV